METPDSAYPDSAYPGSPYEGSPALYQFRDPRGEGEARFRSDILVGLRGTPVSRMEISASPGPRMGLGRAQERESNKRCSGEGHFLSAFRNLPAVLCVPMPEQDFLFRW